MSDSIGIVRAAMDDLVAEGVDGMVRHVHADFEMTTPAEFAAEPNTYRGPDGVRRWFDEFYDVMDRVTLEATDMAPAGDDAVIAKMRILARGGTTGIELTQETHVVCDVAEGKIIGMRFFGSREEALAEGDGP